MCFLLINMTATDQLKIIDNSIKGNQAQYDLDRLAAKTSAYSSGEELGYKPSVSEETKFDYSPLGNIFIKGLDKDDQKERLFKKLANIKDKNEELLNAFSPANKVKNESDFNYNSKYAFYSFYRGFENIKRMVSINSVCY